MPINLPASDNAVHVYPFESLFLSSYGEYKVMSELVPDCVLILVRWLVARGYS